ncbi:hypothetical protein [Citricoccus sp. K5]|uniref:hypothetical protein n=1 Tax=Citricoccus sp. K5 TaxID=2653135 RepID=UPI0012F3A4F3|nr:hypothetical protein [Citricoccus sp. K5]VXB93076.1 conserved hypothetical protein [Citricoccus sp. K5]
MAVDTSQLPTRLPSSGTIDPAARNVRSLGTTVSGHYADAAQIWTQLSDGRLITPHSERVYTAFVDVMKPYADAYETLTDEAATALEDFSEDIEGLRNRYTNAKADAATHNTMPEADRPDDYADAGAGIQTRVDAVAEDYDTAVQTCANALKGLNPTSGVTVNANLSDAMLAIGASQNTAASGGAGALSLRTRDGKLYFQFDAQHYQTLTGKPGNWQTSRLSSATLGQLGVPQSYLNRLNDAATGGNRLSNNTSGAMLRGLDPKTPLGALVARYPFLKNTKLNVDGGRGTFRVQLTSGTGRPPSGTPTSVTALTSRLRTVERIAGNPALGRTLLVGGAALTFTGEYGSSYNESLMRNPDASEAEHHRTAAVDAGVVAGAETAGALVGARVGQVAGAAVGQALIPIPGVGAAIGGVAGNFIGGFVGGKVGNSVGQAINEFRHTDGNVLEKGAAAGKAFLSSLNPFD